VTGLAVLVGVVEVVLEASEVVVEGSEVVLGGSEVVESRVLVEVGVQMG
jgi:hypothetical protein